MLQISKLPVFEVETWFFVCWDFFWPKWRLVTSLFIPQHFVPKKICVPAHFLSKRKWGQNVLYPSPSLFTNINYKLLPQLLLNIHNYITGWLLHVIVWPCFWNFISIMLGLTYPAQLNFHAFHKIPCMKVYDAVRGHNYNLHVYEILWVIKRFHTCDCSQHQ